MLKEEKNVMVITEQQREEINGLYFVNSEWSEGEFKEVRNWLIDNEFDVYDGSDAPQKYFWRVFCITYNKRWSNGASRHLVGKTKTTYKEFKEKYMDKKKVVKATHFIKVGSSISMLNGDYKAISIDSEDYFNPVAILFTAGTRSFVKNSYQIPVVVKTSDLVKIEPVNEKKQALIEKISEMEKSLSDMKKQAERF